MSTAFLQDNNGGGTGAILTVTAPAGATVTVSKDGKIKTKVAGEDGLAVFKGLESGIWRVSLLNEDGSESFGRNVDVTLDYAIIVDFFDGYLYKDGDERKVFTGGWSGADKTETYMSLSAFRRQSSKIPVIKKAYTVLPLDITGYTTITIDCRKDKGKCNASFGIADTANRKSVSSVEMPTTRGNRTLDISGYQGKYLLYFSCTAIEISQTMRACVYSVKIE